MRTTIELPDALFRQAKARAALEGTTLKSLITSFVEQGLEPKRPAASKRRKRSSPPVVLPATGKPIPALTNRELEEILLKEDIDRELRTRAR
ncbi:MAG: hypothetical protein KDD47_21065 [Acidobacteria bacterium]|nr:hypothetical protein [Acidobacteriota bacterium]